MKVFFAWFDKHCNECVTCKRDGLASKCRDMIANRAATDKMLARVDAEPTLDADIDSAFELLFSWQPEVTA